MLLTLALAAGLAHASGESDDAWPPMGPVPKEFDKSQEPPHYGKKVEYFPAKLREILWNARVRKDHPRLYVTPETLPELRQRMQTHPAWPPILRHAQAGHPLACAFAFLVTGEKAHAHKALEIFDDARWTSAKLQGQGAPTYRNALIFDWCFYAIPEEQFEDIVTKLAKAGLDAGTVDPGGREAATYRRFRWKYFDDYTPAGQILLGWSHLYPALAHHWPGAHVDYMNMWHPDASSLSDQLAKEVRSIDGSSWWWPNQGKCWGGHEKWFKARQSFASATGVNIQDELEWGPNLNNRLYWVLYCSDLDKNVYLNHYTTQHNTQLNNGPIHLRGGPGSDLTESALVFAHNAQTRNPHYQWIIQQLVYGGKDLVQTYQNDPMRLIDLALWWDPDIKEQRPVPHGEGIPHGIPFSRFLAPGEMQTAAFRSGFNGRGDTIALLNYSDGNGMDYSDNDKRAFNYGNLLLFKNEFLVTHTPTGPFVGYPWAFTGMSYFDTSTRAETGWDATVRPLFASSHFHLQFVPKFPRNVSLKVEAFESRPEFDYLAARGTPYFWPPSVSKELTQQIVFLRPGVVVLFHRAEAADARYQPRWIMHMKGEWPQIGGNKVRALVPEHVEDYDGDEASYTGVMRQSRLHLKVLLPKARHLRVAHGHLGDTPSSALIVRTQTRTVPRVDHILKVPKEGHFTLPMTYKNGEGEEMPLPAITLTATVQRRSGNMIVKVERDRLRVIQTEAKKDETLLFAHYPTIEDLAEALTEMGFQAQMCARYEIWMEGVGPGTDAALKQKLGIRDQLGPAELTPYDGRGRLDQEKETRLRRKGLGATSAEVGRGSNRIGQTGHLEVRLPNADAPGRHYFLNVLTASDLEGATLVPPQSTLEETGDSATAVLRWPEQTVRVTFRKTGELGGHIQITRNGKVSVDQAFTNEIYLQNQAFGTDFLTGRQKAPQAQGETP